MAAQGSCPHLDERHMALDLKLVGRSQRVEPVRSLGVVVTAAIVAAVALLVGILATTNGLFIGLRDSPIYLSSAENLESGNGFVMSFGDPGKPIDFSATQSPVVDYPIGYPAALSVGVALGAESTTAARWIGIVSLALIAVVMACIAFGAGLTPLWSGVVALSSAALSVPYVHAPMAELLYGLLLVICLGLLGRYLREPSRVGFVLAAVAAAASMAVRTIGIALIATVVVYGLIAPGTRAAKTWRVIISGLIGIVPAILLVAGGGSRELAWHPPNSVDVKVMANAVAGWFVPPIVGPTFRVALFIVLALVLVAWIWSGSKTVRSGEHPGMWSRPWIPGVLSALFHFAVLIASRFLFDAQNVPSSRLLYPVALSLLVAGVMGIAPGLGPARSTRAVQALAVSCIAVLLASSWVAADEALEPSDPASFGSAAFRSSPAFALTLGLPDSVSVFSNVPDGLWAAGRPEARSLPVTYDPLSLRPNVNLGRESDQIQAAVDGGGVIFYRRSDREYLLSEQDILTMAPCVLVDDGGSIVLTGEHSPTCVS
jgi:hypothetical protein